MTGYMLKRLMAREAWSPAAVLLAQAYNNATNPAKLRSDREHQLSRLRARLIRDLRNKPAMYGVSDLIHETEDGRWFVYA
jgi:hypothetical protein